MLTHCADIEKVLNVAKFKDPHGTVCMVPNYQPGFQQDTSATWRLAWQNGTQSGEHHQYPMFTQTCSWFGYRTCHYKQRPHTSGRPYIWTLHNAPSCNKCHNLPMIQRKNKKKSNSSSYSCNTQNTNQSQCSDWGGIYSSLYITCGGFISPITHSYTQLFKNDHTVYLYTKNLILKC